jgi:hypothetical protein
MVQQSDAKSIKPASLNTNLPAKGPSRHHWYIQEIVVGIVVMVTGSFLVWRLGIGRDEAPQNSTAPIVNEGEPTKDTWLYSREQYSKIRPGMTAWEVEDILGSAHSRERIQVGSEIAERYSLRQEGDDQSVSAADAHPETGIEYEEWQWQKGYADGLHTFIGVLVKDGKVVARRSEGIGIMD